MGFVLFGYGNQGEASAPKVHLGNYCIWRFMIDQRYQGQGKGKEALALALQYLRTEPCGKAEYCWLSYEPENHRAAALYRQAGFVETGELCEGEVVAQRKL